MLAIKQTPLWLFLWMLYGLYVLKGLLDVDHSFRQVELVSNQNLKWLGCHQKKANKGAHGYCEELVGSRNTIRVQKRTAYFSSESRFAKLVSSTRLKLLVAQ